MKEDFKNVIITFGLIAFVFMQGFNSYQNKLQSDSIAASQKENLKKIYNKNVEVNNDSILDNQTNLGVNNLTTDQNLTDILKKQAQILLDKKNQEDSLVKKQNQVSQQIKTQTKIKPISQSRQSSAS